MASNFKVLTEDSQFSMELTQAGSKLVVADFTSSRCGPCQRIGPAFANLAGKFPNAIFLKIDIQQCPNTAQSQGVTATPTFIFYRNSVKVDLIQGADVEALETRIRQHYGEGDETEESGVPGHMDLLPLINKSGCECLNESDEHPFASALTSSSGFMESDADEQLIIYIQFSQAVKLHSIRVKGPADCGPKTLKLFINQPYTLDFDSAESHTPVQLITLSPKDLEGELVPLKYVKFQNIMNLTVFIKDNQTGAETTRVSHLQIIGSPQQTTNMSDFKRVAGKKGESH